MTSTNILVAKTGGTKHYDLSDRYYIFMVAQLFSD
nr:MAG TPA: hypothetical protein [Caudoviricetes sp.]